MTTYRVLPRDDGHDFRQSWMLHRDGAMVDNYTTKEAAETEARRRASDGDVLVLHRTDGTIQKRVTVRAASADSDSDHEAKGLGFGIPRSDGEHGQGTLDVNDLL